MNCLPYGVGKNDGNDHQNGNDHDDSLEYTLNQLAALDSLQTLLLETAGRILMMMVMVVMLLLLCHYFLDIV